MSKLGGFEFNASTGIPDLNLATWLQFVSIPGWFAKMAFQAGFFAWTDWLFNCTMLPTSGMIKKGIESKPMHPDYHILYVDKPDDSMWEAIGGGIHRYNTQQAGDARGKSLCFVLYAPDQTIAGGLIGETHWDWFYINLLWVRDDLRGHGYGHRLLTLAEQEARQRGAMNAYLDTFSFQAPDFYQRHGYQVFGELHDFPPGHQRYYLTKQL
jgi:GNAT superfamily N-acetyltransferase